MAFDELCDRVHLVVSEEFCPTASEPDSWAAYSEFGREREGDPIEEILYEIVNSNEELILALKNQLSNSHFSFDDAAAGEEDPYGDEVHYVLREPNDYELLDAWSVFQEEIRTRARFFSQNAQSVLDGIFSDLDRFRTGERALIRHAGPGTSTVFFYRARRAFTDHDIARIVEHPARELGAPPSRSAGSGRMNPRWIPMFYGALDADTCIAEVRAPVGSSVVIGKFKIIRPLQLLDLGALRDLTVEQTSFFDPAFRRLRDKALFLKRLVWIMSRPVMPHDEDFQYLPTQAAAEYLSEMMEPKLDGLIFPSSQRGGPGENMVLFRRASIVKPDGSDDMDLRTDFGWTSEDDADLDIMVFAKEKAKEPTKVERKGVFVFDDDWTDLPPKPDESPALRIDLDAIQVLEILAVEYRTCPRRVRRVSEPADDLPF